MASISAALKKVSDFTAVLILLFIFWQGYIAVDKYLDRYSPWLEVHDIHVDDYTEGYRGPVVTYSRTIHREFTADWFVKAYSHENSINECYGTGKNRYQPQDDISHVTMYWYVGRFCNLVPGDYTLNTIWVNENGRSIQRYSNKFTVHSKDRHEQE